MFTLRGASEIAVIDGRGRSLGRVTQVLFHPSEPRVVGLEVKPPWILGLVPLPVQYYSIGAAVVRADAFVFEAPMRSRGKIAASLHGFGWDDTVIYLGMPAQAADGSSLGVISDMAFAGTTGRVVRVALTGGLVADAAVGTREVDGELVEGFDGERVVFAPEAAGIELSGGAAAAAGRTAAIAQKAAGEAAQKAAVAAAASAEVAEKAAQVAGRVAAQTVRHGAAAAKVAAGSKVGKKAMGILGRLRDEVVDAMGDPDDE